jgi:hypothetical protein
VSTGAARTLPCALSRSRAPLQRAGFRGGVLRAAAQEQAADDVVAQVCRGGCWSSLLVWVGWQDVTGGSALALSLALCGALTPQVLPGSCPALPQPSLLQMQDQLRNSAAAAGAPGPKGAEQAAVKPGDDDRARFQLVGDAFACCCRSSCLPGARPQPLLLHPPAGSVQGAPVLLKTPLPPARAPTLPACLPCSIGAWTYGGPSSPASGSRASTTRQRPCQVWCRCPFPGCCCCCRATITNNN